MNLIIAFILTILSLANTLAMEDLSDAPLSYRPNPTPRSNRDYADLIAQAGDLVDRSRIPQWTNRFPLTGGGSVFRHHQNGFFIEQDVLVDGVLKPIVRGAGHVYFWKAGEALGNTIPSTNVQLSIYMKEEEFRKALEKGNILAQTPH